MPASPLVRVRGWARPSKMNERSRNLPETTGLTRICRFLPSWGPPSARRTSRGLGCRTVGTQSRANEAGIYRQTRGLQKYVGNRSIVWVEPKREAAANSDQKGPGRGRDGVHVAKAAPHDAGKDERSQNVTEKTVFPRLCRNWVETGSKSGILKSPTRTKPRRARSAVWG